MATIHQRYSINAPIEKVWQALVDQKIIGQWSSASAKMGEEIGFEFELWDGDISGTNIAVEKPNKLVQEWRYGDWPKSSKVTFELTSLSDRTEVALSQVGHPKKETRELEKGWDMHYLGAIKEYLERSN